MDGENNGKPCENGWFGGFSILFGSTPKWKPETIGNIQIFILELDDFAVENKWWFLIILRPKFTTHPPRKKQKKMHVWQLGAMKL